MLYLFAGIVGMVYAMLVFFMSLKLGAWLASNDM